MYKARLVVKVFGQRNSIDFDKILFSYVKMSSIHIVLGLTASLNLDIEKMDVETIILTMTYKKRFIRNNMKTSK